MISAKSALSLDPYDKPRVLLIHPDAAQRSILAVMLARHFRVQEAHGAIDGLSSIGGAEPDVVILAQEMRGVAGSVIAHKLRQSGHNMPIILVGSKVRRLSDQAGFLQVGVDVCLEYPINAALLNLHVDNLLRRVGRLREPLNDHPEYLRPPQRSGQNCTTDLDVFLDRAVEEMNFSRESGLPVPVCVMHCSPGNPMLEELSSAALLVTRSSDLFYVGTRGVAILLPESRAIQPFLGRFSKSWIAGAPPTIEQPEWTDQDDLRACLSEFLMQHAGPGFVVQGATERKRVKPFGVANGSSAV
jgi:CheY-like chemotaxis protein